MTPGSQNQQFRQVCADLGPWCVEARRGIRHPSVFTSPTTPVRRRTPDSTNRTPVRQPDSSRETPLTSIGANMPGHFDVSPFPERWFLPDDWRDRARITGHPDARWGNIPNRDRLAFSLHFRLARGACWTMLPDGP